MKEHTIKVPFGARVVIGAPKRAPGVRSTEPEINRGTLYVDEEEELYVQRPELLFTFYDLGTRLRSVAAQEFKVDRIRREVETGAPASRDDFYNEYVEIELEGEQRLRTPSDSALLRKYSAQEIEELNRRLLGSRAEGSTDLLDPLGFNEANVSGRKLPNCMPVPHLAGRYFLHVGVNDEQWRLRGDATEEADQTGGPEEWVKRKAEDADAVERWNPYNLSYGDPAHGAGLLKPKAQKRVSAIKVIYPVNSPGQKPQAGVYERFDTSDAVTYKLTAEPIYEADEAAGGWSGGAPVRVYLRPRFVLYTVSGLVGSPHENALLWHGRTPVYPHFWFLHGAENQQDANRRARGFAQRSALASGYLAQIPLSEQPTLSIDGEGAANPPTSLAGSLAAVIAQGSRVRYVWRRVDGVRNGALSNPLQGGLVLDTPV